jgi:hypothetical protein
MLGMRLDALDRGHRLPVRLFFGFAELTSRVPMSDVPKTLLYRPEVLGGPLLDLSAPAMRGPSFWSAAEREHMAMATAQWLRCPFCVDSHAEMTRIASDGPFSARPELTAILPFLEQVTLGQSAVRPDLPDDAIEQALRVNLIWNVVNRVANAFGFELRPGQLEKGTRSLHRFGYRFPGFLTGRRSGDPLDNLRQVVYPHGPEWEGYVGLVRDKSHRITSEDIAELKRTHVEDEIFEITASAAVSAGLRAFDAGMSVVRC